MHDVEVLEKKLQTKLLTIENRERLEEELQKFKQVLRTHEDKLLELRKENAKSFKVALYLIFGCFSIVFAIYLLFFQ